uniref:Uncharacterized protein n=1 Tax=Anguilla anguilla TaxID=7936 RepID=A0A0E9PWI1_ANGAN
MEDVKKEMVKVRADSA